MYCILVHSASAADDGSWSALAHSRHFEGFPGVPQSGDEKPHVRVRAHSVSSYLGAFMQPVRDVECAELLGRARDYSTKSQKRRRDP
jgi:hypothetical protein